MLMGRTFSRPERMRMFLKQYVNEMAQLGINSIGIVLIISFFIGAVICIQMKLNIQSPWMPRWVAGYTTREILLLEFSSSIMCLILAGKVGSNIASELGTMRVTQQIDALEIMGINSACYLILPKILGMLTIMPILVIFSSATGILGAYGTAYVGHIITPDDLTEGLQHAFIPWFVWMSIIKSQFFAFIISSVPAFCGYTVEGGSVNVGKASTDAVVTSSSPTRFFIRTVLPDPLWPMMRLVLPSSNTVLMSFSTSLSSKLLYKCLTSIMIVVVLRRRHYKG